MSNDDMVVNDPARNFSVPEFHCPVHGNHGFTLNFGGIDKFPKYNGSWCMLCIADKLDELGIHKVSRIS